MDKERWALLAEYANWARENRDVLTDTHWIDNGSFVDMKQYNRPYVHFKGANYKIYGWASWIPRKGIITLRNPKDEVQYIDIDLESVFELPKGAQRVWQLKSPWKEDSGTAAITMTAGTPHRLQLKPFEVLVLETIR
ncbi:MAG TPA: hypothetical protein QGF50_12855 [Roseibacillus sp.]|jgi:hypothetical protein|nr:hypothetical protein [Roseibacillus sp.]